MTQFISANAFTVLGITPALGRFFSPEEDHIPGNRKLAILSYDYWQRNFNADPAVLGRLIWSDADPYEVIGVTRKGFFGVETGRFIDIWMPLCTNPRRSTIHFGIGFAFWAVSRLI